MGMHETKVRSNTFSIQYLKSALETFHACPQATANRTSRRIFLASHKLFKNVFVQNKMPTELMLFTFDSMNIIYFIKSSEFNAYQM